MRILYVAPYAPNFVRVRPYNLIRSLSKRGHLVTVLTLVANHSETDDIQRLANFCHQVIALPISRKRSLWNCVRAIPSRNPLQSVYSWQPKLARQIGFLVQRQNGQLPFDVMHVEHLRGARYGLYVKQNISDKQDQIPIVWDSVDCISTLFEKASAQSKSNVGRLATRFELGRTRQYETWLLSQFDKVVVTSPTDRNDLADLANKENISTDITVVPNGVDLNYFTPIDRQLREQESLVVSGKMSYHANVTMVLYLAREIMPLVWSRRPNAKLTVVGKDPPREIKSLSEFPSITVTGTVADIRPYLQKASIAAVPIRYGAGIQNKALEAMACGTPVIASPKAVDSLSAVPERDLLVAEGVAVFADKIVGLLDDSHRRSKIGIAGRKYVEDNHHWGAAAGQLEQVYRLAAADI